MNGFEMILPFLKPIEHLILDDTVSEVMVNGSDHVFIEKGGFLQEIRGLSLGEKSLMIAVKNIARRLGDDISEAKPILDSRLPDGSRVAAVIPPCSLNGVTLTIRKFNARHLAVSDLVEEGTLLSWESTCFATKQVKSNKCRIWCRLRGTARCNHPLELD
jgi:pilus assembly protein CpaF